MSKSTARKTVEILQKRRGKYLHVASVKSFSDLVEALKQRTPADE